MIAFGLSLLMCTSSIQDMWVKWRASPVTMSFNENTIPISAIPFPTVTICPETKTYKVKTDLNRIYDTLMNPRFEFEAGSRLSDQE